MMTIVHPNSHTSKPTNLTKEDQNYFGNKRKNKLQIEADCLNLVKLKQMRQTEA
jgi:hypothetical protein